MKSIKFFSPTHPKSSVLIESVKIDTEYSFLLDKTRLSQFRFKSFIEVYDIVEIAIVKLDKLWGVFNILEDKFIIPPSYQSIEYLEDGIFKFKLNKKFGLIDVEGIIIIPNEYTSIFYHSDEEIIHLEKDNKYGIVDMDNNVMVPFIYDTNHIEFARKAVKVSIDGKYGMISFNNDILIPLMYKSIEGDYLDTYIVKDFNDKSGIIDAQNNIILPLQYDWIHRQWNKDWYQITDGDNMSVFDKNMGQLIPFGTYVIDKIIDKDRVVVRANDKKYGFFFKGKLVIDFTAYLDFYHGWESFNALVFQVGPYTYDVYSLDGEYVKQCEWSEIGKLTINE